MWRLDITLWGLIFAAFVCGCQTVTGTAGSGDGSHVCRYPGQAAVTDLSLRSTRRAGTRQIGEKVHNLEIAPTRVLVELRGGQYVVKAVTILVSNVTSWDLALWPLTFYGEFNSLFEHQSVATSDRRDVLMFLPSPACWRMPPGDSLVDVALVDSETYGWQTIDIRPSTCERCGEANKLSGVLAIDTKDDRNLPPLIVWKGEMLVEYAEGAKRYNLPLGHPKQFR
jgi:hypothetical protein